MNVLLEAWRQQNPDDTRSDLDVLRGIVEGNPEVLTEFPGTAETLRALGALGGSEPGTETGRPPMKFTPYQPNALDYVKEFGGSVLRGAAEGAASLPRFAGQVGAYLESKVPLGGQTDATQTVPYRFGDWLAGLAPQPKMARNVVLHDFPEAMGQAAEFLGESIVGGGFLRKGIQGVVSEAVERAVAKGTARATAEAWGKQAMTRLQKLSNYGVTAGIGAQKSFVEGFSDASRHDGTMDQRLLSGLLNAGVGLSEAVPMAKWLDRLNGMSGNTLIKRLIDAGKEGLEEGLQEALQSGAGDVIAANWVKYDPDRKLFEELKKDAAVGGGVGVLFSLLTQTLGGRRGDGKTNKGTEKAGATAGTETGTETGTEEIKPAEQYQMTPERRAEITVLAQRAAAGEAVGAEVMALAQEEQRTGNGAMAFFLNEKARLQVTPTPDIAPVGPATEPAARTAPVADAASGLATMPEGDSDFDLLRYGAQPPAEVVLAQRTPAGFAPPPGVVVPGMGTPGAVLLPTPTPGGPLVVPDTRPTEDPEFAWQRRRMEERQRTLANARRLATTPAPAGLTAEEEAVERARPAAALETDDEPMTIKDAARTLTKDEFVAWAGRQGVALSAPAAEVWESLVEYGVRKPEKVEIHVEEFDDAIRVSGLMVPEKQRGQGLGTAEMEKVIAQAKAKKKPVLLTAHSPEAGRQADLNRFYEGLGFKQYANDPLTGAPRYRYDPVPAASTVPEGLKSLMGEIDLSSTTQEPIPRSGRQKSAGMLNLVYLRQEAEKRAEQMRAPDKLAQAEDMIADLIYTRSAAGDDNKLSRKVVVMLSPDDQRVMLGTAFKSGQGESRQKVSTPKGGRSYRKLRAEGWTPITVLTLKQPRRDFNAEYSLAEWLAAAQEMGFERVDAGRTVKTEAELAAEGLGLQGAFKAESGADTTLDEAASDVDVVEDYQSYLESAHAGAFFDIPDSEARPLMAAVFKAKPKLTTSNRAEKIGESISADADAVMALDRLLRTGKNWQGIRLEQAGDEVWKQLVRRIAAAYENADLETATKVLSTGGDPTVRKAGASTGRSQGQGSGKGRRDNELRGVQGAAAGTAKAKGVERVTGAQAALLETVEDAQTNLAGPARLKGLTQQALKAGFITQAQANEILRVQRENGSKEDTTDAFDELVSYLRTVRKVEAVQTKKAPVQLLTRARPASVGIVYGLTPAEARSLWTRIVDRARAQGLNVQVLEARLLEAMSQEGNKGLWTPGAVAVAVADASQPTTDNVVTLLHEIAHEVFNALPVDMQARLHRAIAQALAPGWQTALRAMVPGGQPDMVILEELLVEHVAQALVGANVAPEAARSWAQQLWIAVKELWQRAALWVSEAFYGQPSPDLARRFLQTRVQRYLQGDYQSESVLALAGGPRGLTVDEQLALNSGQPVRWRAALSARLPYVGEAPPGASPDLENRSVAEAAVAKANETERILSYVVNAWTAMGHNPANLDEDWLANLLGVPANERAAYVLAEQNADLQQVGEAPVPASQRWENLPSSSMRDLVATQAWKDSSRAWHELEAKQATAAKELPEQKARLAAKNDRLHKLMADYQNAMTVSAEAQISVNELLAELPADIRGYGRNERQLGVVTQALQELDQKLTGKGLRSHAVTINRLVKRMFDLGSFFDVLQQAASVPGIEWDGAAADIANALVDEANANPESPMAKLFVEANIDLTPLLGVLIAFGRSNAHMMGLLNIRRLAMKQEHLRLKGQVNQLFQDALADVQAARKELRNTLELTLDANGQLADTSGRNSAVVRLGVKADRVLQKLEAIQLEHAAMQREIRHQEAVLSLANDVLPLWQVELARLEKVFGGHLNEFAVAPGAMLHVPASPQATLEEAAASTRTLSMSVNGHTAEEVRNWMANQQAWLDAQPPALHGAVWNQIKSELDALKAHTLSWGLKEIHHGWFMHTFAPITDRLTVLGTPAARALAGMFHKMQMVNSSKLQNAGVDKSQRWLDMERKAQEAVGYRVIETFRRKFYRDAYGFWEKRQDLLAMGGTDAQIEQRALAAWRAELGARVNDQQWAALKAYYQQTNEMGRWMVQNAAELGLLVEDKDRDGKIFYRKPIGAMPFTLMRATGQQISATFNEMRQAWDGAREGKALGAKALTEAYADDPGALRQRLGVLTAGRVWTDFVEPICRRTGRSSFYGNASGGARRMASVANVRQAAEESGQDLVRFAERLAELEGIAPLIQNEFVGETLAVFNSFYNWLHGVMENSAYDVEVGRLTPKANEISNVPDKMAGLPIKRRYLMDARTTEEIPTEWLDYMPFGPHETRQLLRMQSFEYGFGRDMGTFYAQWKQAQSEQETYHKQYLDLHEKVSNAHPDWAESKVRKEMRRLAEAEGKSWRMLTQAKSALQVLAEADTHFKAMLNVNRETPAEITPWMEILGTLAGMLVQGPGTALVDTIALIEQPFRKMGFNVRALRWAAKNVGNLIGVGGGSLMQAAGLQSGFQADRIRRMNRLGFYDSDAKVRYREKLASVWNEPTLAKNPILKAAVKGSRVVRFALGTGLMVGKGKREVDAIFPTPKPHAIFTWQAQMAHMAMALSEIDTMEGIVAAGVEHFHNNPADLANLGFEFAPEQLGLAVKHWLSGDRDTAYLRETLNKYGLNLETMVRDAYARRQANPGGAELLDDRAFMLLAQHGQNEVTLESNYATRMPGWLGNPVLRLFNPLLGWSLSKGYDTVRSLREPDLQLSWKAGLWTGLTPYLAVLPISLAYALLRDEYDEEVVGRKQNVINPLTTRDPGQAFMALVDNLARVGTFGFLGEGANALVNWDTQRPFSVDSRVYFISSAKNTMETVGKFFQQGGTLDYQTVVRPLVQSLGGSGYLQYAGILNTLYAAANDGEPLFEREAQVSKRIAVGNYLRVAGRQMGWDVRTGAGMRSAPRPTKPYLGQMMVAAMSNDPSLFQRGYMGAITEAQDLGYPDPADYVYRALEAMDPRRLVFRTTPSDMEYQQLLMQLDDDARQTVHEALTLMDQYTAQVKPRFKVKPMATGGMGRNTMDAMRRMATR